MIAEGNEVIRFARVVLYLIFLAHVLCECECLVAQLRDGGLLFYGIAFDIGCFRKDWEGMKHQEFEYKIGYATGALGRVLDKYQFYLEHNNFIGRQLKGDLEEIENLLKEAANYFYEDEYQELK